MTCRWLFTTGQPDWAGRSPPLCSTRSQSPLEQNTPHANTRIHHLTPEVPGRNPGSKDNVPRSLGLPYGLIVGADYLRKEESILDFGPGKGFKHNPNAAWIPLLDHTPPSAFIASLKDSLAMSAVDAAHRTSQSHEDTAWEDDSTLEWDVYLNNGDTSTEGYVSKEVQEDTR